MARYEETYDLRVGDVVWFRGFDGSVEMGTVQCVSELPDVFVEVEPPYSPTYSTIRISVRMITSNDTNPRWFSFDVSADDGEALEFVYDEGYRRVVGRRYEKTEG